jgi:hypothetical protein
VLFDFLVRSATLRVGLRRWEVISSHVFTARLSQPSIPLRQAQGHLALNAQVVALTLV